LSDHTVIVTFVCPGGIESPLWCIPRMEPSSGVDESYTCHACRDVSCSFYPHFICSGLESVNQSFEALQDKMV